MFSFWLAYIHFYKKKKRQWFDYIFLYKMNNVSGAVREVTSIHICVSHYLELDELWVF